MYTENGFKKVLNDDDISKIQGKKNVVLEFSKHTPHTVGNAGPVSMILSKQNIWKSGMGGIHLEITILVGVNINQLDFLKNVYFQEKKENNFLKNEIINLTDTGKYTCIIKTCITQGMQTYKYKGLFCSSHATMFSWFCFFSLSCQASFFIP